MSASSLMLGWNPVTGEEVKVQVAADGTLKADAGAGLTVKRAFANVAQNQVDSVLVAAVALKRILVLGMVAQCGGTATNATLNTKGAGAGVAISSQMQNAANGGRVLPYNPSGWYVTSVGEALTATTGAGSTTGFDLLYAEVD